MAGAGQEGAAYLLASVRCVGVMKKGIIYFGFLEWLEVVCQTITVRELKDIIPLNFDNIQGNIRS